MKKYRVLFKNYLITIFEYRAIPITWALIEIISIVSGVFLWLAVYREQAEVAGYDLGQMIFYFALVPLIGSLTYVYVSSSLPKQIKDGRISMVLLKPYSLAGAQFLRQLSMKVAQQLLKVPLFLVFLIWLFQFFEINLTISRLLLAIGFSLFSFALHFFMDLSISYTAFWLDEIWALSHLKMVAIMMFGGMIFPLDLIPQRLRSFFNFLPLKFLYFYPVNIAQGRFSFNQIMIGFGQLLAWLLFFYFFSKILWKKGLRRYGAYGN